MLARQHTDMKEEMRTEAIEVIVSSVEKFAGKYDLAVMLIPSPFRRERARERDKEREDQVHMSSNWRAVLV